MSSVPSRGELYDWEQADVLGRSDQDLPFYLELALVTGGPVLELTCGTGRITAPLARAGLPVIGLDLDREMLEVARRRCAGLSVGLVQGDMRRFALARPVPLVAVPYNALQLLLTPDDRTACFASVAGALAPGGRLAFELRDFVAGVQTTDVEPEPIAEGRLGASVVTLHAGVRHDLGRRITTYRRRFELTPPDGDPQSVEHDIALYSYADGEIEQLLTAAGLEGRSTPAGAGVRWVASRISASPDQGG